MSETPASAFVIGPGEGREVGLGEFRIWVKATGDDTGGAFSLIESGERSGGAGPPMHIHHDAAESFWVLAGAYTMIVDDREYACPAGSFVYVPAGVPHTFRLGPEPSRKLNLYTPAAMVGYFDELSDATKQGDVDPDVISGIAERYSMEVLGPVPERYV